MDGERATTSRRRFLGTAAGATGVALGAVALGGKAAAAIVPSNGSAAEPALIRTYNAGSFALELDGAKTGFLKGVEGGGMTGDVVEFLDGTGTSFKHVGNIKFEDIAIDIDFSQSKTVFEWIDAAWQKQHIRKSGAIVAADFNYEAKQRREFYQALISEVSFPALDASDKKAAALTVKIAVEQTLTKADSGKVQVPATAKQKAWSPQNFRFELADLDCKRVTKVDAFSVKVQIVEFRPGGDRLPPEKVPGKVEFPNLVVTFDSSSAATWTQWFDDFVIKGNNGQDQEKTGKIVFLAPNNADVLAEIELFGVGIFKLEDGVFDPVNEPSAVMRAHLYVEKMRFKYVGGATPQPTPTPNSG